jgi:hypothetical protein
MNAAGRLHTLYTMNMPSAIDVFARLARRAARLPETTLAAMEHLVAVGNTSAFDTVAAELVNLYMKVARKWWGAVYDAASEFGEIKTNENPIVTEDDLRNAIKRFARQERFVFLRMLPPADANKAELGLHIAHTAAAHGHERLATLMLTALVAHPDTLALTLKRASAAPQLVVRAATPTMLWALERLCAAERADDELMERDLVAPYTFSLAEAVGLAAALDPAERPAIPGAPASHRVPLPDVLHAPADAAAHLDTYVGGYLADLDLSQSYITGSAAMSSALRPAAWARHPNHASFLRSWYPALYTDAARPAELAREIARHDTPPVAAFTDATSAMLWWPDKSSQRPDIPTDAWAFSVRPGTDVDIAIDAGDDFDAVAHRHFAAIARAFPDARLVRAERPAGHMWRVEVPDARRARARGFREVEMYPAGWAHICTHHVPMVRLAYTAAGGGPPQFRLTATCLLAALTRTTCDYQYFASRKTTPQDIIQKYATRGYPPSRDVPEHLHAAILRRAGVADWAELSAAPPETQCRGGYSLFALVDF